MANDKPSSKKFNALEYPYETREYVFKTAAGSRAESLKSHHIGLEYKEAKKIAEIAEKNFAYNFKEKSEEFAFYEKLRTTAEKNGYESDAQKQAFLNELKAIAPQVGELGLGFDKALEFTGALSRVKKEKSDIGANNIRIALDALKKNPEISPKDIESLLAMSSVVYGIKTDSSLIDRSSKFKTTRALDQTIASSTGIKQGEKSDSNSKEPFSKIDRSSKFKTTRAIGQEKENFPVGSSPKDVGLFGAVSQEKTAGAIPVFVVNMPTGFMGGASSVSEVKQSSTGIKQGEKSDSNSKEPSSNADKKSKSPKNSDEQYANNTQFKFASVVADAGAAFESAYRKGQERSNNLSKTKIQGMDFRIFGHFSQGLKVFEALQNVKNYVFGNKDNRDANNSNTEESSTAREAVDKENKKNPGEHALLSILSLTRLGASLSAFRDFTIMADFIRKNGLPKELMMPKGEKTPTRTVENVKDNFQLLDTLLTLAAVTPHGAAALASWNLSLYTTAYIEDKSEKAVKGTFLEGLGTTIFGGGINQLKAWLGNKEAQERIDTINAANKKFGKPAPVPQCSNDSFANPDHRNDRPNDNSNIIGDRNHSLDVTQGELDAIEASNRYKKVKPVMKEFSFKGYPSGFFSDLDSDVYGKGRYSPYVNEQSMAVSPAGEKTNNKGLPNISYAPGSGYLDVFKNKGSPNISYAPRSGYLSIFNNDVSNDHFSRLPESRGRSSSAYDNRLSGLNFSLQVKVENGVATAVVPSDGKILEAQVISGNQNHIV